MSINLFEANVPFLFFLEASENPGFLLFSGGADSGSGAFFVNFEHFTPCSRVSIVNFEHLIADWDWLEMGYLRTC